MIDEFRDFCKALVREHRYYMRELEKSKTARDTKFNERQIARCEKQMKRIEGIVRLFPQE